MTALYRLTQGLRALFSFTQTVDYVLAAEYLSPPLLARFRELRRSEQLHSLRVLRALLDEGDTPHDLAVAALLHDVGKSRYPMSLWQRSLPVVVKALSRRWLQRLSAGDARNRWLRGFVVYVHHPAWSADIIAQGGGSADAVWLAAQHATDATAWREHRLYAWLVRLQRADDAN
ncbi:MAG: hypothetical protein SF123_13170 [Chloroflexota bacterium]|nr:hypothetical protein [Chloroflexota bacterium]